MAEDTANNNTGSQETTEEKKKVRKHKVFSVYKPVVVEWRQPHKTNLNIFVSVNNFTATFRPGVKVELPELIIKFLKEATYEGDPYYDKASKMHKTKAKPKYFVDSNPED